MEFRILGPLEVCAEGRELSFGGAKQRAVFAILLLYRNEVVSIDRLIDELWAGQPPATAAKTVQVYISQLRKMLRGASTRDAAGGVLVTRAPGYLLRVEPGELDTERFEQLVNEGRSALAAGKPTLAAHTLLESLALWRGPALADFALESFATREIVRLEEARVSALEDRIEADLALGRHAELAGELESLVAAHPLRERLRGQLMLALYRSGRQVEALAVYRDARRVLVDELGLEPSQSLQSVEKAILMQDPSLTFVPVADDRDVLPAIGEIPGEVRSRLAPAPRFAKSGDVHIAYCVAGDGPVDVVYVPGWVSNVELMWTNDRLVKFLDALAAFCRLIVFDKRGTGLSDRVPDQALPDLETRMDDVRAVMDAVGSRQAFLLGQSEGGPMSALFAATYPQRTLGLVLYGSDVRGAWAPDHTWGMTADAFRLDQDAIDRGWGTGSYARAMVGELMSSQAADPEFVAWWARYFRQSASPSAAMALNTMWYETDARDIMRSLALPTLVVWRTDDPVADDSRWLAANVPGAYVTELPGRDHVPWIGDTAAVVEAIRDFLSSVRDEEAILDRAIVTVLVTDVVGSTRIASELGDREWRALLERHHAQVRAQVARYKGRKVDTAGDGFVATFNGPTRAVRCSEAIRDAVATLGLEVRAGVHTGELGTVDGKVTGIAINIAARISETAAPSEVLVSQTVKDLTAGSGITFDDAGDHNLEGVANRWRLYRVMSGVHGT